MRWPSALAMVVLAATGCGHEPVAPPGEDGWIGGVWTGALTHGDRTVTVDLWLEQDGTAVAGAGAERTTPGAPESAPADLACRALERADDGVRRYRMPTDLGADVVFAISLDPSSHALVGQWAADSDLADEGGEVTLTRVAWLPTREVVGGSRNRVALGCFVRPPPACADGLDNDGDGRIDAADLGCCPWPGQPCALIGNREDAEPSCANGLDDDGDGAADALDPECGYPAGLEVGDEPACGDHRDDDGDGLIDLADPGCGGDPHARSEVAPMCADGVDNDGDGATDAADPECSGSSSESPPGAECDDGYDNDGDGATDVADPSCHGQPGRPQELVDGTCDDGIDNDGDGLTDLDEPTCAREFWSDEDGTFDFDTDCTDGVDNDGDAATDLADPDCVWYGDGDEVVAAPAPVPPREPDECNDGVDGDGDGRVDLADPDCAVTDALTGYARFEAVPACQDGVDDDGDGAADALDPDCATAYGRHEQPGCADGIDNDGDGLTDGADPTCAGDPAGTELARACGDGQDNDGDGAIDAADPDCRAAYDWSEAAACADGRDNDGDGRFDLADPGCAGATDDDENP